MQAGGYVSEGRVNGSLNLSRALGDMDFKQSKELLPAEQMITAMPDVRTLKLQPGDEFLILACDGIWEMLTNQEVGLQPLRQSEKPRGSSAFTSDKTKQQKTIGFTRGSFESLSRLPNPPLYVRDVPIEQSEKKKCSRPFGLNTVIPAALSFEYALWTVL